MWATPPALPGSIRQIYEPRRVTAVVSTRSSGPKPTSARTKAMPRLRILTSLRFKIRRFDQFVNRAAVELAAIGRQDRIDAPPHPPNHAERLVRDDAVPMARTTSRRPPDGTASATTPPAASPLASRVAGRGLSPPAIRRPRRQLDWMHCCGVVEPAQSRRRLPFPGLKLSHRVQRCCGLSRRTCGPLALWSCQRRARGRAWQRNCRSGGRPGCRNARPEGSTLEIRR